MEEEFFNYLTRELKLSEEEKEVLRGINLFRTCPKGSILLRQGEYARESFFVMQGLLRTYYLDGEAEITTGFYLEEEGLSPESLVTNEPSEFFISCEEDCLLVISTPEMEERVFRQYPSFKSLCLTRSEQELAKSKASFSKFINSTPKQRYLELVETRPQLLQRVPQHQIASYLGIKPESLSRIRKRLRESERKA